MLEQPSSWTYLAEVSKSGARPLRARTSVAQSWIARRRQDTGRTSPCQIRMREMDWKRRSQPGLARAGRGGAQETGHRIAGGNGSGVECRALGGAGQRNAGRVLGHGSGGERQQDGRGEGGRGPRATRRHGGCRTRPSHRKWPWSVKTPSLVCSKRETAGGRAVSGARVSDGLTWVAGGARDTERVTGWEASNGGRERQREAGAAEDWRRATCAGSTSPGAGKSRHRQRSKPAAWDWLARRAPGRVGNCTAATAPALAPAPALPPPPFTSPSARRRPSSRAARPSPPAAAARVRRPDVSCTAAGQSRSALTLTNAVSPPRYRTRFGSTGDPLAQNALHLACLSFPSPPNRCG